MVERAKEIKERESERGKVVERREKEMEIKKEQEGGNSGRESERGIERERWKK